MAGGGVESDFRRIFGGDLSDQKLAVYVEARRYYELAQTRLKNPSDRDFDFFHEQWAVDDARRGLVRCREVGGEDLVMAVLVSGLVAGRSWLYQSNQRTKGDVALEVVGRDSKMSGLVREATVLVDEIRPRNRVGGTTITLESMAADRAGLMEKYSGGEIVSLIGLNGSGKTTAMGAVGDFMKYIGLEGVSWVKFPRPAEDSPMSDLIQRTLRGEGQLHRGAIQLLMLAEMVDYLGEWGGGGLLVTDRLAALDGQVYDVEAQRHISLAMLEVIGRQRPVSFIVLDRHPLACWRRRVTDMRVTVGDAEQFVGRAMEMYRLATLPGAIVVNNDIDPEETGGLERQIFAAKRRVVTALVEIGAIQRQLVHQRRFDSIGRAGFWLNQQFSNWVISNMSGKVGD